MAQAIQIVGALIILGAFAASQLGEMPTDSRLYLALNVVGSVVLAVLAVIEGQIGFILLEGSGRSSRRGASSSSSARKPGSRPARRLKPPSAPPASISRSASFRIPSSSAAPAAPSQSVWPSGGRGDAGVAERRDVLEGEHVLPPFEQRRAARPPLPHRRVEDRLQRAVLPFSSSAAFLGSDALGAPAARRRGRRAGR